MVNPIEQNTPKFNYKTIITPPSGWQIINLQEIWRYRDLLINLTWRSITVRYKQTILGATWAILQPLTTMVIFTVIFGGFAKIPSDGIPYPIFSFSALVPWTFFASALTGISGSIVSNINMLKKVYFPRIIFPLSTALSSLVDFLPSFAILLMMIIGYKLFIPVSDSDVVDIGLSLNIIFIIPYLVLASITALGFGLWLAALNVQFRDVRYATGFIVRLWMYITPVIYPTSLVEGPIKFFYYMNPMVSVIDGFRWAILGSDTAPGSEIFISIIIALLVLTSGLIFFNRTEKLFADVA